MDTADGVRYVSANDGSDKPAPSFRWCLVGGNWPDLVWSWGNEETLSFRAAEYRAFCDQSWDGVFLADVAAADTEAFRSVLDDAGNGWHIGVDIDGVLSGFRISEQ